MGRIIFMNATYHHPASWANDQVRHDELGLVKGMHYRIAIRQRLFGYIIDVRLVNPYTHKGLIGARMTYLDMAAFLYDWEPKQLIVESDQEKEERETAKNESKEVA